MPPGLLRRANGRYYIRRVIPIALQALYGRKVIVKAHGTSDPGEARRLHARAWVGFDDEFNSAKNLMDPGEAPKLPAAARLQMGEAARTAKYIDHLRAQRDAALADGRLEDWSASKRLDLSLHNDVLAGREPPLASLSSHELSRNVLQAILSGRTDQLLQSVTAVRPTVDYGPLITEVLETWRAHAERRPKTIDKARRVIAEFEKVTQVSRVGAIKPHDVQAYKQHLVGSGAAPATGISKLNLLRAIVRFARANLIITGDPCDGIQIKANRNERDPRIDYSPSALKSVFSNAIYALDERPVGGGGEAAYWLPIMALYTGARLNELGQLRPKDIVRESYIDEAEEEQQAWVIRLVIDKADGLTLKNKRGERRIPVHDNLARLGFLKFVESARDRGMTRLLPDLQADKYGTVTANWSKWYGRYLRQKCLIADKRITFHSFRHTFKDRARYSGLAPDVQNEITGHETGDVANTYSGLAYPLLPLVRGIQKFKVPHFELPAPPPAFRVPYPDS